MQAKRSNNDKKSWLLTGHPPQDVLVTQSLEAIDNLWSLGGGPVDPETPATYQNHSIESSLRPSMSQQAMRKCSENRRSLESLNSQNLHRASEARQSVAKSASKQHAETIRVTDQMVISKDGVQRMQRRPITGGRPQSMNQDLNLGFDVKNRKPVSRYCRLAANSSKESLKSSNNNNTYFEKADSSYAAQTVAPGLSRVQRKSALILKQNQPSTIGGATLQSQAGMSSRVAPTSTRSKQTKTGISLFLPLGF